MHVGALCTVTDLEQLSIFARVQGILTQVIFEHALRIRTTTETTRIHSPSGDHEVDGAPVVGNGGAHEQTESEENNQTIAAASTTSISSKTDASVDDLKEKDINLKGKINNLITADIAAVEGGQLLIYSSASSTLISPSAPYRYYRSFLCTKSDDYRHGVSLCHSWLEVESQMIPYHNS